MPFLIAFVCVLVLYFLLIFPSLRRHRDRQLLQGKYIAHRGLHNKEKGIPENSIPAFLEAAANGYLIENDIHITADGEVVVFHDATTTRMCSYNGKIEEMTLSEIKKLNLDGTQEKIPTLKECLSAVDGRVPLLIEFKCDLKNYKELCQAANKILSEYKGKYFIQSFNPAVPFWYRFHRKDILRGQLAEQFKDKKIIGKMVSNFFLNLFTRPDFVAFGHKTSDCFSFKLQKFLGAFPIGWTFKQKEDLEQKKNRFKAYIFENFIP